MFFGCGGHFCVQMTFLFWIYSHAELAIPSYSLGGAGSIMVYFQAICFCFIKLQRKPTSVVAPISPSHVYYPYPLIFHVKNGPNLCCNGDMLQDILGLAVKKGDTESNDCYNKIKSFIGWIYQQITSFLSEFLSSILLFKFNI